QGYGVVSAPLAVAAALRGRGGALAGLALSPRVSPDTVTFYCYQPGARQVSLVGTFNNWQPAAGAMWECRPGVWQIILPALARGPHTYKFLVDDEHWTHDLDNPARIADGTGGFFSLLSIAGAGRPATRGRRSVGAERAYETRISPLVQPGDRSPQGAAF